MGAEVRRDGEAMAERAAERVAGGATVAVVVVGVGTTGEGLAASSTTEKRERDERRRSSSVKAAISRCCCCSWAKRIKACIGSEGAGAGEKGERGNAEGAAWTWAKSVGWRRRDFGRVHRRHCLWQVYKAREISTKPIIKPIPMPAEGMWISSK